VIWLPRLPSLESPERPPINRAPSRLLARTVPWVSVMAGSVAATTLWITSAPVVPPLGLLMLIGWRQVRPGLLPIWAGLPLGLFDDLISGQPVGCAVLLWSLCELLLDGLEQRIPWRRFAFDWFVAAALIAATIALGVGIANLTGGATPLRLTLPQIGLSILAYPMVARMIAVLDRFRLLPIAPARAWD
jgi:rod shape-determining protein MreD